MAQWIPLPLTVSCSSKIQIGFTFLVPAHPGSPGQRAVKWVCVCVAGQQWGPLNQEEGRQPGTWYWHLSLEATSMHPRICTPSVLPQSIESWEWKPHAHFLICRLPAPVASHSKTDDCNRHHDIQGGNYRELRGVRPPPSSLCQPTLPIWKLSLGLIKRTFVVKTPEVMLNLYKTLVPPHLEYCISVWSPHWRTLY